MLRYKRGKNNVKINEYNKGKKDIEETPKRKKRKVAQYLSELAVGSQVVYTHIEFKNTGSIDAVLQMFPNIKTVTGVIVLKLYNSITIFSVVLR